ncbi:uncharacterized protein LOC125764615 [Anopheles funestus]|uniref:uncharacterized protein LOC125764615 n=1 Tax=Anopheles funestus TaxID=62324 RepID=UPI0020C725A6|nr:uncharacterized protein LOC125764615 [Anopheles funestus]XP_049284978.1 uncharacterized protein LOC125764615 [Anopheles funestus]XP_049284979.1 uncharacterized protein LOC125764615 [Anopheles funestus]XP_049284980.1 uncharacterized protein LOC125764615 [Anopheles funestus]XP_049284981.1 uncharacterized protein LOC125764615 [Anopheles funestus]
MTNLARHQPQQGNGFGSGSSIHDYPEHLNPFYEDENHKRLRFLERKSHRRGSLSSLRDGIREWWQYSSIRFGKKRSSTLGINKTSESPPPLRRDTFDDDSFAGTSGYRNTVNASGYGTARESQSYTTTPLFVRHTRYRSSLQDHPKDSNNDEIGFMRNDRYRSTIQNGFATYNTGMVTSTPRKKQAPPKPYGTTPRVPRQEYNNVNPFDVDLEPEGDTLSTVSVDSSYSSTLRSRTSGTRTRTKRRAPPPPPVAVAPANRIVSTPEEPSVEDVQNEDLRNLTAEIESFVRISSVNGDASAKDTSAVRPDTNVETTVQHSHDVNNNNAQAEIPTTVSTIEREIVAETRNTGTITKESVEVQKLTNIEQATIPKESNNVVVEKTKPTVVHSDTMITVDTTIVTVPIETSPTPSPRKKVEKTQPEVRQEPVSSKADVDFENLALPETPVPTRRSNRENREKYITQDVSTISKLTNEKPTVPKPLPTATSEADDEGPTTTIIVDNLQYKHKVAPIHTEISSKIETARMKISESTGNITTIANENNTNERRRSVRDIIESINKSQSMLKVNHEQSSNSLHETQSTDSMVRNIRELNEREKEIQNLLQDIDARYGPSNVSSGDATATTSEHVMPGVRGSYYDNLTDDNINDNLDEKNNMYAASGFRIKKSPTKTVIIAEGDDPQFQDCINWNPLPKPRRSHILVENGADTEQSVTVPNAPS